LSVPQSAAAVQARDVAGSGAPLIRTDVVALEPLRRGLADAFSVFSSGV
jgi:hypothetical protein